MAPVRSNSRRPLAASAARLAAVATLAALALAALPRAASAGGGRTFFVATDGSDSAPGTKARPWRTIQKAASTVPAGSTVEIRGGVYHERVVVRVSGAPGAWITFHNYAGEHVRLDGTGLGPYDGIAGLVAIDSRAYVAVQGLEIAHFHDLADTFVPAGVFVTGSAHHISLRGLDVHDIRTATADAHGIAVYGTSGDDAIHDVTIDGNQVHDNHLGSSESVVVNGNVRGWAITHNHIWRNDNIGIDAIGFEGKAPRNDQARDGYIADNLVTDIDSLGNPAYDEEGGGNCRCADGIYVDGGRDLLADPLLGAGSRPKPGSPAIDAGLDTPLAGPFDLYGAPRRQGRAIDIGAVET
jgi:hypothetical protein